MCVNEVEIRLGAYLRARKRRGDTGLETGAADLRRLIGRGVLSE